MAEGGDVTSIKDGSDARFDIVCTPCGEGDVREEAVKYCPDCQEYLCTTCTIHHGRQKATRSHKLLDRDTAKQGLVSAVTTKCRYHPDRDIEMYCAGHDMVYCLKCIVTDHRACSGVIGIEEIKTSPIQQNVVDRLQNDASNIQERLENTDKKTQKNTECLKEQRDCILWKLEEAERSLIEHIRELKHEAASTLNRNYKSLKEELKSNTNLIANMEKEIKNAGSQLHIFTRMDAGQQFVEMKLIQHTVNDAVKLVEDSEAKGSKALCFTENTDLKTSILKATSFGHLNTVTESDRQTAKGIYNAKPKKEVNIKMQNDCNPYYITDVCQLQDGTIILADVNNSKIKSLDMNYNIKDHRDIDNNPSGNCCQSVKGIYKVKSKKEINVKMQKDRTTCYIVDVCQLQDGTLILADCDNGKIKRLDINYNIKDRCALGHYLMGICCTGQNEVAVKMYNDKVQFISVGSSFSKQREISVAGGIYWGMAYSAGEMWISTGSGVNVYSTSGSLLKTISKGINGRDIFKSFTHHMAVSGETVIVTDNSDRAVCLGRDYTVQRELRDERLVGTRGVCVSSEGTVFLSGYNSHNIVMFNENWKRLGELVTGLKNPVALHYDDKRKCLIVTCSEKIFIFDISA